MTRLERMLETLGVELWWSDELWQGGGTRRAGWVGVADVFCNRNRIAVSVPRRRRGSHHFSEVIHEVAHLFRWVQTGVSPSRHNEVQVCSDAIVLAQHFGMGRDTIGLLRDELARELQKELVDGLPVPK